MLARRDSLTERKMFGGIAWMIGGNMACGVIGDEVIVRVAKDDYESALADPQAREFDFTGRPMRGFVCVSPAELSDEQLAVVDRRRLRLRGLAAREKPELADAYDDEAMTPRGQLTLFTVRGIRIGVDYLLVLRPLLDHPLALGLLPRRARRRAVRRSGPTGWRSPRRSLFFGSILLHELGHAVVANRYGIPITEITLWLFGGVARMSRDSDSAGTEFKIAAAGPGGDPGPGDRLLGGRDRGRRRRRVRGRDPLRPRRRHLRGRSRCSPGWRRSTCSS